MGQSTPPPSPITLAAAGQPLTLLQFQAHRYATLQNGPARDPADARRAKPPLVVAGRAQRPDPSSPPFARSPRFGNGYQEDQIWRHHWVSLHRYCRVHRGQARRHAFARMVAHKPSVSDDVLFMRGCSKTPTGTRTLARARTCIRPY